MSGFLRGALELGYWALFRPTRLHRYLKERVPYASKQSRAGTAESAGPGGDDEDPSAGLVDALWARSEHKANAALITAQFSVLSLILTAPLLVSIIAARRPWDLILIPAALFSSIGLGVSCAALGLMVPFFYLIGYHAPPQGARVAVDSLIAAIPYPPFHPGALWGLIASVAIFGATVFGVRALWRGKRELLGLLALMAGTWVGIFALLYIFTSDFGDLIVLAALAGLSSLIPLLDREDISKTADAFIVAVSACVTLIVGFYLLRGVETRVSGILAGSACLLLLAVMMISAGGFFVFGLHRPGRTSVIERLARGIAGGILGGILVPLEVNLIDGLAFSPLAAFLIVTFMAGFGAAPTRVDATRIRDLARALYLDGWMKLRKLPGVIFYIPSTRWFLLVLFSPVALRSQHGWSSLLAIPVVLAGYYRILPDYIAAVIESGARSLFLRRGRRASPLEDLKRLPPFGYEMIELPLPGHAQIAVASFHAEPAGALSALQGMMDVVLVGPRRACFKAAEELETLFADYSDLERGRLICSRLKEVASVDDFERIAIPRDLGLVLLIPGEYDGDPAQPDEDAEPPSPLEDVFRSFRRVAQSISAARQREHAFMRERDLERCAAELDGLEGHLKRIEADDFDRSEWLVVIKTWRAVLLEAIEAASVAASGQQIVQPFQSGAPLPASRSHLFKGRKQVADDLMRHVLSQGRPALILHGPWRCGKSSFLLNLWRLFPAEILPVYVDMQSQAMTSSEGDFCYGLVHAAIRDLNVRGLKLAKMERRAFQAAPYPALEDWLDELRPLLGTRRLLFCLDEFEKLGEAIARGAISRSVFDELRHLIQHREELSFILCGAQILEELGPDWSSYFVNARPMEMLYLEPEDARELLIDPDPNFNLKYHDTIVEEILAITRCQPYLLQIIGEAMVNAANRHGVREIDQPLLEEALVEALAAGEIYFHNLWNKATGSTPREVEIGQEILSAIACDQPLPTFDAGDMSAKVVRRLERYRVIEKREQYQLMVPMLGRWIRERGA